MIDNTEFYKKPQTSVTERLEKLESSLVSLEKTIHDNQLAIDSLNLRMEQLEDSFLDELFKSTKTKFDNFRSYLADKLKP